MPRRLSTVVDRSLVRLDRAVPAARIASVGRAVALAGVVAPLFWIGIFKFTQVEVEALKPLISATPWLSWLYVVFGETLTSYLLGVVELVAAALLIASLWSARAGAIGAAIATLIFATTVSIMLAVPIWEDSIGGFPWINTVGQFLLKDIALLGISLAVFAQSLTRLVNRRAR
ncbi:DUF417 family protein [Hansschlegelia sp. KR7-227]|uniref:DUF417 family protein n=1 Tax=Hansschlegelia sp. KR7-227 TaxID=3400914 RepID=UPI003BFFECB0